MVCARPLRTTSAFTSKKVTDLNVFEVSIFNQIVFYLTTYIVVLECRKRIPSSYQLVILQRHQWSTGEFQGVYPTIETHTTCGRISDALAVRFSWLKGMDVSC
ncbi:hypothetical protein P692DRAFT_20259987 [Suillus brevipes Sb2]|nr:hypothetical protein P692DRAFT_20259987 [Suillus brevipes Sb2]